MTPPTAAQFDATVAHIAAELCAADPATIAAIAAGESTPACLAGVGWARNLLDRAAVAELCEVEPATVSEYVRRARAGSGGSFSAFPEPGSGTGYSAAGAWEAGRVATWKALQKTGLLRRWPKPANGDLRGQAAGALAAGLSARQFATQTGIGVARAARLYREAGAGRRVTGDGELIPVVRGLLGKDPRMPIAAIRDGLREAGYRVGDKRVSRILAAVGRPMDPMPPDHPAGWWRAATLARAAHVTPSAVARHARTGALTPWARDRWGCLYDPQRIAAGQSGRATPADADWIPGGGGEKWIRDPANGELLPEVRSLFDLFEDGEVTVPDVRNAVRQAHGYEITGKHAGVLLYLA